MTLQLRSCTVLTFVVLIAVVFAFSGWSQATVQDGIDPADPMVRITYTKSGLDVPSVLAAVSRDVSKATGLGEKLVTYYWQTFDFVHCMGKSSTDKPIFVDLYVPGFFTDEQVAAMLNAIADSLVKHTGLDRKWVFIHTHFPLQGHVYINGEVAHWENYRGQTATPARDATERRP